MDFPFLLEQFQQELEELVPAEGQGRANKRENLFIDIESIEEEPVDDLSSPKNSRSRNHSGSQSFVFTSRNQDALEFPNPGRPIEHSFLGSAYVLYAQICKQSFEMVPAPTPSTLSLDSSQMNYEELIEKTHLVLGKIQARFQRSDKFPIIDSITQGSKLLLTQLEENVKSSEHLLSDSQKKLESAFERNLDLERRCEMAETSYELLFDRLKAMEDEIQEEHTHKEQILQESFHLQDLLKSASAQEQQASMELEEIQNTIVEKEEQIAKLQREVRRLNSRKVLHEIPTENTNAMEVRSIRKERMSSGATYLSMQKDKMSTKTSPVLSPSSAGSRLSVSRVSETRQLSMLNALLTDKQKQLHTTSKALLDKERRLGEWEYHLKCKETDLDASLNQQLEHLKEQLDTTQRRLFSEQNKNKQLELALSEMPRYSASARIDSTEGYEDLSILTDSEIVQVPSPKKLRVLSVVSEISTVDILPRVIIKPSDRRDSKPRAKESCCGFF